MAVIEIKSPGNQTLQLARLVADRSRRAPADLVLAEGIRVLDEALRSGCVLRCAIVAEDFGANDRESALRTALESARVRICRTTPRLLRSVSSVVEPQRAVGLVRLPALDLGAASLTPDSLVLCLCGLQDPGNLGTLLRTARAAGATLAIATRATVSARNPKAVRASAGAIFYLPVVESAAPADVLSFLSKHGIRPYRAHASEGKAYHDFDLRSSTALLLGSEAHGFRDPDWRGVQPIRIPMAAGVESLNVAIAGSVILLEAHRQRRAGGRGRGTSAAGVPE